MIAQRPMKALNLDSMGRSAVLDGRYRYELRRNWDSKRPPLVVCMLNPSTADHERDDPTIQTLAHFAHSWGYGGIIIVNLFALRSPSPKVLRATEDRIGAGNGRFLEIAMGYAKDNSGRLLAAWGNGGDLDDRDGWFCSRAYHVYRLELICLGTTRAGHPKHPLARGRHRIPRDQQPIVWREGPKEAKR